MASRRTPGAGVRLDAGALPLSSERELRLDLFRGLALWLIFIDHVPDKLLNWFTIRNYGFSDATEIFIFISGYTAALVYGRAMRERGFLIASARILRRAWQIYVAHIFLFTIFMAEIAYVAATFDNPLYAEEMNILDFLKQPDVTIFQALLLKFKPVNMDVLPLYIVLMLLFPPMLLADDAGGPTSTLALLGRCSMSLAWKFDLQSAGLSERRLVLQSVRLAIAVRVRRLVRAGRRAAAVAGVLRSPRQLWLAIAYLCSRLRHHADLVLSSSWPRFVPPWLSDWMYPIDKTNLDVLRFAHFLALAAVTVRFVPRDWPGLKSPFLQPAIVCGQHSLEIFCLGVFLAFAGYFVLIETNAGIGLHILVGIPGILIMSAVAYMASWYKQSSRTWGARNGDIAGGG